MNSAEPLSTAAAVALKAALDAGEYFSSRLREKKSVKQKSSPADLVTEVDPECERIIKGQIAAQFPDHDFLGEESVAPGSAASAEALHQVANKPHLWIVDPLDGTTNFVYSMPLSVVSIAYAEAGVIQLGVVYDPYRQEAFLAVRGKGARLASRSDVETWLTKATCEGAKDASQLPGEVLTVSRTTKLSDAILASGFPPRVEARLLATEVGYRLTGEVKSFRALGSAALHLAYVASGRIDSFWEHDLNAWDLAAGVCLVQEAGGVVQSLAGSPYDLAVRDILVAGTEDLARAVQARVRVSESTAGSDA